LSFLSWHSERVGNEIDPIRALLLAGGAFIVCGR
jgi:hypothetical protein